MLPPDATTITAARPFRGLMRLLAPARGRLVAAGAFFLLKDSPNWVMPVITAAVIDALVRGSGVGDLLLLGGVALLVIAINYPANIAWVRLFFRTVRDLAVAMRNALAHRLQELSIGFHTRSSSSIIQTKVVRDVENVELMLQQGVGPLLSAAGVVIGASIVLAVQVPLSLILFAVLVPASVALVHAIRSRTEARNERFRRDVEQLSSRVGEMASLLPITRAHALESTAAGRVLQSARDVRDSGFRLDLVNGRFGALAWVVFQVITISCLIGAAIVSATQWLPITPGQVVLLSTYFVMMTNSIVMLLNLMPLLTRGRESLRSIAEVLEEPDIERNAGRPAIDEVSGELRFECVRLRYAGDEEDAIRGVDLEIPAGRTVAFVGPSGSGKSTLLNLALGFVRPTSGVVRVDGIDMEQLDLRTMRRFVSVVPQESVLFAGTIRDNITYGLDDVDDDRVRSALIAANAAEFVDELPEGWSTIVGERGARLSGGQRQRLSIARALIRDPRILLLDEATSALDSDSERLVQEALARLMRGRTTLVVAHRLSTIRSADLIVVLDHGSVVESGAHDELLARGGDYARLVRSQAA